MVPRDGIELSTPALARLSHSGIGAGIEREVPLWGLDSAEKDLVLNGHREGIEPFLCGWAGLLAPGGAPAVVRTATSQPAFH